MKVTSAMTSNPLLKVKELEKMRNSMALVQVCRRTKMAGQQTQDYDTSKNF